LKKLIKKRKNAYIEKIKQDSLLIEVYLHWMLCRYLDGDFDEAKLWLNRLREINSVFPEVFLKLDKYDIRRLQTIGKALDGDMYVSRLNKFVGNIKEEVSKVQETEEELLKEKQLVRLLIKNEHLIRKVTGLKNLKLACTEQDTRYGFVDLMAYSKVYAIPIEVKLNRANHQIVGQIIKYMKHYLYKVNYKIWRDVIGITVAKDYSTNAAQELKKINVIPLQYSFFNNVFSLKRAGE